jgi:hypothetical protein
MRDGQSWERWRKVEEGGFGDGLGVGLEGESGVQDDM